MFSASEAAAASKTSLENLTAELKSRMQDTINSAIKQGSCKATFYPRNAFECANAMTILTEHGYDVKKHDSKDQRDHDRIDIQWGI